MYILDVPYPQHNALYNNYQNKNNFYISTRTPFQHAGITQKVNLGENSEVCSGGSWFEFWLEHWLFWLEIFMIFLNSPIQMLDDRFHSDLFQVIVH